MLYEVITNVRELENILERAVVLAEKETICCADLELHPQGGSGILPHELVPRTFDEFKERKKQLKEP